MNVLVTGIQVFFFEDDIKTCLQCAFGGVNSTTAVWSGPGGTIAAPFGSVSNGVLEICNTEEFIAVAPVVLTCTQTTSHQIITQFRSELLFLQVPSMTVLLLIPLSLSVFTPPLIFPDIDTVDEGETLFLACVTTSNPLGGFMWYGPDGFINNEISFTIPNIARGDSGNYSCVIENDRSETLSTTRTITVQCKFHFFIIIIIQQ